MDEIFGEDNFVRCFTWVKKDKTSGVPPTTNILPNFEYVLCYKTNGLVKAKGQSKSLKSYKQQEDGTYVRTMPIQATGSQDNYFNITDPKTGFSYYGNWAFTASTIADMIDTNRIVFPKKRDGKPTQLVTATESDLSCIFAHLGKHDSEMATKNFSSSFDNTKVFDFPKPLSLLEFLIEQLANQTNAVILDCFAGSGTTGHAVMKLNAEDGGQRQYICVQLPEKLDPKNKNQATACDFLDGIAKPRTIAEITKERLRRAGAKIRQEHPDFNGDLGFKVFKQVPSQQLQASQGLDLTTTTEADLEALREAQIRNQQPSLPLESVNPLHLAYEVMLKRHTYPLTALVERITFAGHDDCFRLGSEAGALCIFATEININAIIKGLIEILEHDDSAFPSAVYMLENAFHSAGEYNDFASALEQLSTHYNIGTGKAERGEQPTLKFYTL